jgi:serine/threonine protein kinase
MTQSWQQELSSRYRCWEQIGMGGFGRVFAGERLSDTKPVAIKVINRENITNWDKVRHWFRRLISI